MQIGLAAPLDRNSFSGGMDITVPAAVREAARDYYGRELSTTNDLKTAACMLGENEESGAAETSRLLRNVHPAVKDRFFVCGSPIPPLLASATVLDLGCGTGRDVYVAAQLVGEGGLAIGVDMTEALLAVAQEHETWHASKFGFSKANTQFVAGDISDLRRAGIKDASVDVVISNCVLNLAPDKGAVLREGYRVLRPGGQLFFSDVYTDRRVPAHLQADRVLWGECLSGALYVGDFARLMRDVGFRGHYVTTSRVISVGNAEIAAKCGAITFYSQTVSAFKLAELEEGSEDYGQTARYDGTIPGYPHAYPLGLGLHPFITGAKTPVDGNTALVLTESRYAAAFRVTAAKDHRGAFRSRYGSGVASAGAIILPEGADEDAGGAGCAAPACCPPTGGAKDAK